MLNRTFFLTALAAAVFMVLSLQFLKLFSFIKWSPVAFMDKDLFFPKMHISLQWLILFVLLFVVFMVCYAILFNLHAVRPSILAIVFSLFAVLLIEWFVDDAKTPTALFKSVSIPLLSIIAITFRFIAGTAVFYKELSKKQ